MAADKADLREEECGLDFVKCRDYTTSKAIQRFSTWIARAGEHPDEQVPQGCVQLPQPF